MARKKFKNSSTFSNWKSKKKPMANGGIISDPPTKTNTSKDDAAGFFKSFKNTVDNLNSSTLNPEDDYKWQQLKFDAIQRQEAEEQFQREQKVSKDIGFDPRTGKNIPQWQRMGASSADEWYNNMHDSGAKEILKTTVVEPLYEATGIPAAERIYKDPLGHLKAVGNTVGDLVMMPLTAFTGDSNVNPLTGKKYYEDIDKTLDVAGVIPSAFAGLKTAAKTGKKIKNLKNLKNIPDNIKGVPSGESAFYSNVDTRLNRWKNRVNNLPITISESFGYLEPYTNKKILQTGNNKMTDWVQNANTQGKLEKLRNSVIKENKINQKVFLERIDKAKKEYKKNPNPETKFELESAEAGLAWYKTEERNWNQAIDNKKNFISDVKHYPLKETMKDMIYGRKNPLANALGVSYRHGNLDMYGNPIFDYFPNPDTYVRRKSIIDPTINSEKLVSTVVHEGLHDWQDAQFLTKSGQEYFINQHKNKKALKATDDYNDPTTGKNFNLGYFANPTEIHARIQQVRDHFNIKPGELINIDQARNILKDVKDGKTFVNKKGFSDMFTGRQEPEEVLFQNLVNNLYSQGGYMNTYKPLQYAQGGYINNPSSLLKLGINENRIIQDALTSQGFDTKGVDGYIGQNTTNAVKEFQKAKGLKVDGIIGKNTINALFGDSVPTRLTPAPGPARTLEPLVVKGQREAAPETTPRESYGMLNSLQGQLFEGLSNYSPSKTNRSKKEEPYTKAKRESPFKKAEDEVIVLNRQKSDNASYGRFMSKGNTIINRTGKGRQRDSNKLVEDIVVDINNNQNRNKNTLIIDIGSGLGNDNPQEAGISVAEMSDYIYNNADVVATDIPDSYSNFEKHKKAGNTYKFDSYKLPLSYNTPVGDILKTKTKANKKEYGNIILRAANGIDLLMNEEETKNHLRHIAKELDSKKVYYIFNKDVLYKAPYSKKFEIVGEVNNAGFDHRTDSWNYNLDRVPYSTTKEKFAQGGYLNNPPYKQQVGPIAKPMTNYIPMNPNRPFYVDDEGMSRSEYKITVSFDDNSYVLPTVWEGKQHTEKEAINKFLETGEHMGKYKTQKEAEKASQVRTGMYNMHPSYRPNQMAKGGFFGGDNKFGNFVGNAGLALADNSLALVGATDVIGEKNYLGDNASDWAKGTDIAGEITQVAGQVAATALGGPAAGMALGAVQNTVGSFTDKEVTEAEAMASQLSNIAGQGFMMVNPGNIMNNPTTTAMANGGKIGDPPRKKYLITIPGTGETKEYMLTKEQADAFFKVNEMNTMLYEASKDRLGIVDNEGYKALSYKGGDQIGDTKIASGTIDIDKDFGAPRAFLEDPNYKPEDNPLLYNAGWDTMKKQKFYFDNIYKWNKLIQNDPTLKKDLSIGEDYRAGLRHMYTGKPVETETPPVDNNPGRIQGGAVKSVHDYGDIRQVGTSTYVPDNVQLVGVAKDKAGKQMVDNTGKLSNIYSAYTEGGGGTGVQGYSTDRPDNIITQEQEAFRKNKSANVRDFQTTAIRDNKAYGGKMLYPDGGPLNPALMNQLSGNVPYTIPSGSISSGHGGEFTGFGGHTTRQKMTPGMSGNNMSIDQMDTTSMMSPAEYAKMAGTNAIGGVQDFTRSMQGMMPTEGAYTPPVQFATSTFGNGGYMAMGGDTSRNPLTEFNGGGTHEENEYGGIPQGPTASVEEGETKLNPDDYIFSNRIKVPGKKTTFADESKKINKKYSLRENDTIDDSQKRRDLETLMSLQEEVKERKAQKHQDALAELGYAPQLPSQPDSNTQSSTGAYPIPNSPMPQQGMPQMSNGGRKPTQVGGLFSGQENVMAFLAAQQNQMSPVNPFSVNANAGFQGNVLDYADQALQNVINSDIAQQIGDPRFALKQEAGRMNPVEGRGSMDGVQRANYFGSPEYALQQDARNADLNTDKSINYANAAKAVIGSSGLDVESFGQDVGLNPLQIASQYAPIAANIAGALNRDTLDAQDYQVTPQNIDPVTMNINPQLRANEQSFQGTEQAIRGAVAGNAGAYLANVGQAQGSKQGADARAYTQKENYDNQMAMLADKYNSQIGMQADLANANVNFQVDDWNARSKANQFAQLQDAAYNLQGLGQADMNNQLYLEAIKAANPNYAPKGNMSYMPWFKGNNNNNIS